MQIDRRRRWRSAALLTSATLLSLLYLDQLTVVVGQSAGTAVGRVAGGAIAGRVMALSPQIPLAGSAVRIEGASLARTREVVTDGDGNYEFRGLPQGRYSLFASKTGYVTVAHGQRNAHDHAATVNVNNGESVQNVNFALPKASVIVVRLTDDVGDSVRGFYVHVLQRRFVNGQVRLVVVNDLGTVDETDDRGEIRIFGLPSGEYFLTANPGISHRQIDTAETFYPGTAIAAEAQPVHVAAGEEAFVAFSVIRAPRARVAGTVISASGTAPGNATVELRFRGPATLGTRPISLLPDGHFTAFDVPAGEYVVRVRTQTEQGLLPVRVFGEDLDGLRVEVSKGATVRGRVVVEGGTTAGLRAAALRIVPTFLNNDISIAPTPIPVVRPDWTFELAGVKGVGVLRVNGAGSGWSLRRVVAAGRDLTDTPVDFESVLDGKDVTVFVGRDRTELTVAVHDEQDARVTDAVVVVFPQNREHWTPVGRGIVAARPDQFGRVTVMGLAPGRYAVAAVEYLAPGEERNPVMLGRLLPVADAFEIDESATTIEKRVKLTRN